MSKHTIRAAVMSLTRIVEAYTAATVFATEGGGDGPRT